HSTHLWRSFPMSARHVGASPGACAWGCTGQPAERGQLGQVAAVRQLSRLARANLPSCNAFCPDLVDRYMKGNRGVRMSHVDAAESSASTATPGRVRLAGVRLDSQLLERAVLAHGLGSLRLSP